MKIIRAHWNTDSAYIQCSPHPQAKSFSNLIHKIPLSNNASLVAWSLEPSQIPGIWDVDWLVCSLYFIVRISVILHNLPALYIYQDISV